MFNQVTSEWLYLVVIADLPATLHRQAHMSPRKVTFSVDIHHFEFPVNTRMLGKGPSHTVVHVPVRPSCENTNLDVWIRPAENLLDPMCLFGAYFLSTDEGGHAWPHETRLLIKAYREM